MATTKQTTFGDISANLYRGERECDGCTGFDDNGDPQKCTNSAHITILRHATGVAEFYCKVHSKDTWIEMAE